MWQKVLDWDDAYSNAVNIPLGHLWPSIWVEPSADYRAKLLEEGRAHLDLSYGNGERNKLDLFLPNTKPLGLVVFVHGGFWQKLDRSYWSHLARGANLLGYAVAIPSYSLCPQVRISDITQEVSLAIEYAAIDIDGPIYLIGHSAGGHLVTRMITQTSPLSLSTRARIKHVVSVSGLHDLRPLMRISMNETLRLDANECIAESPSLLMPIDEAPLTCWVGAMERSEFLRQNSLLANVWRGLGAATQCFEEPDRHHFNILDSLFEPDSALTDTVFR